MTPQSASSDLTNVTVKEAAAALAARAVAVRAGSPGVKVAFEKAAGGWLGALANSVAPDAYNSFKSHVASGAGKAGLGNAFGGMRNWWGNLNPVTQSGIQGTLAGGLAGGALGMMRDDEDERHPFFGALRGAMVGGALGAGGHLAYNQFHKLQEPTKTTIPGRAPTPPNAAPPADNPYTTGHPRSGVRVPEGNPTDEELSGMVAKHNKGEAVEGNLLGIGAESQSLHDRQKWTNRAMEGAGHFADNPLSAKDHALTAGLAGGTYEMINPLRRAWASRPSAVRQNMFDASNSDMLSRYGMSEGQAQAMHGASPVTRDAFVNAMRNNGRVGRPVLDRVPTAERSLLDGVVDAQPTPARGPTLMGRLRSAVNPIATGPAPGRPAMPPPVGYARTVPGQRPAYGGLTGGNIEEALRDSQRGLRTAAGENIRGPLGGRWGRVAGWGAPFALAAGKYLADNSGPNPDELHRLQNLDALLQ